MRSPDSVHSQLFPHGYLLSQQSCFAFSHTHLNCLELLHTPRTHNFFDIEPSESESGGPRPPELNLRKALLAGLPESNCTQGDTRMDRIDPKTHTDQPVNLSNALVVLYLTEETGLPCNAKGYDISTLEVKDLVGNRVKRPALRVTFDTGTSTKQPCHLLTFGSDDQLCNIILTATEASPTHCSIYAQLNSGPDIWVIEDTSANGTQYLDEESLRTHLPKSVARGRVAVQGLRRIQIGRTIFSFWSPSENLEKARLKRYFRNLDPIPVTQELLGEQLRGVPAKFRSLEMIGDGGMGKVFRYMETTTGLMIAVKEEEVENKKADERVQKEIGYMQSLRHVSHIICFHSSSTNSV